MDRAHFWNQKIISWEADKYDAPRTGFASFDPNQSLKKRLSIAASVIRRMGRGATVLELGCGSGRLIPTILESGVKQYIGIDLSALAIEKAKARVKDHSMGTSTQIELLQGDVLAMGSFKVDFCFSLGFLDWLTLDEIRKMLAAVHCQTYLHSYSRDQRSWQRLLHRLYVFFLYGYRSQDYVPRYYRQDTIRKIFRDRFQSDPSFFAHPKLSFGEMVYRLPKELPYE